MVSGVGISASVHIIKAKQLFRFGNYSSKIFEYIVQWIIVLRGNSIFILSTVFMSEQNILKIGQNRVFFLKFEIKLDSSP